MAITTVPQISGPNFGGLIYGLSLEMSYSESPSKLILNIVSKNGQYEPVTLKEPATVQIGNSFKFVGYIWGYSIEESADQRILKVEIVDGSIRMDQHYVLLWKRNFFGQKGEDLKKYKEYDLSDEILLLPQKNGTQIKFKEFPLGKETIERKVKSFKGKVGNVFLLGQEKFKNSNCDIPSTYYTLKDLNSILGEFSMPFTAPDRYIVSHEGNLREVISAWCQDFGYSWYWDFSADRIKYYDVKDGVATLPNYNNIKEIIKKDSSESMEGTYAQHAIGYISMPKEPFKTLSSDGEIEYTWGLDPYPLSYFLRRSDILNGIDFNINENEEEEYDDPKKSTFERWGNRSKNQFLIDAFLGYLNPAIRSFVLFSAGAWKPLGIEYLKEIKSKSEKEGLMTDLKQLFKADIEALEKIDAPGLPNFGIIVGGQNTSQVNLWYDLEQTILSYTGKFYRQPNKNISVYLCRQTSIEEITITSTPVGSNDENNSKLFSGNTVFSRGGIFSHTRDEAELLLDLQKNIIKSKIESLQAYEVDLVSTGLQLKYGIAPDQITAYSGTGGDEGASEELPGITGWSSGVGLGGIDTKKDSSPFATKLWIFPKPELIQKILKRFEIRLIRKNNPLETDWKDNKNSQQQNFIKKCEDFEKTKIELSCEGSEEEARRKQYKKLTDKLPRENKNELFEGLENKIAKGLEIKIGDKKLELLGPSDARYRSIIKVSSKIEKIKLGKDEFIYANTSTATLSRVAKLNVIQDNLTDPIEDEYKSGPASGPKNIPHARAFIQSIPQKTISYTFAGLPRNISLSPGNGLYKLDIQYSSDGVLTTAVYQTRPKLITQIENFTRKITSQFNREAFNSN
jgi:hypothetical protein